MHIHEMNSYAYSCHKVERPVESTTPVHVLSEKERLNENQGSNIFIFSAANVCHQIGHRIAAKVVFSRFATQIATGADFNLHPTILHFLCTSQKVQVSRV